MTIPRAGSRAVMLGLDGVAWSWISAPWVESHTPNLQELLRRSVRSDLVSTIPPYTAPAWTTMTTGVEPGRHGVFGFTDASGRPTADSDVTAPRVWDAVSAAGGRSIVVNVPLTFPPRPIEGVLVAGMPAPSEASVSFPDTIAERFPPDHVVDVPILGTPDLDETLSKLRTMTRARRELAVDLLESESWDLFAIVFVLPDRLGHAWWKYMVPGSDLYETKAGSRFRGSAAEALRELDRGVEAILSALPAGTTTVVCSDHGFGPIETDVFFDLELVRAGLMRDPRGRSGKLASRIAQQARVKALIPRSMLERGKARFGRNAREEAAAWTAPKYEGGIRLADGPDRDQVKDRVLELLRGLTDQQGRPIVEEVLLREDVFPGPHRERAPDLLPRFIIEDVELHEGVHSPSALLSRADLPWGTHARTGIISVESDLEVSRGSAEVADVAPTLLAALGLRVEGLDGDSLVASDDLVTVTPETSSRPDSAYSADEEAEVMEHLRGLGYVE